MFAAIHSHMGRVLPALMLFGLVTAAQAQFVQQGFKLVGTGYTGPGQQGYAVALSADGRTAIVGAFNDVGVIGFPQASGIGAVWICTRSNNVWTQQGNNLVGGPYVASDLRRQQPHLALTISFSQAFGGDRIFYLAARDGNDLNNTGWQSMGIRAVQ